MGRSRRQRMSTLFGGNLASGWMRAALLLSLASLSKAQVGTNICSCSPPTYEFTLDFSLSCDDSQLDGQGISDFECVIAPFQTGANIDLTPASVETIDFVEFDQALGRLAESSLFQQFLDGQSFTYTATTADPGSVMMPTVPRALQVTMLAQNSIGQPLLMTWLITFSNSCNDFPVINVGNRVGWTTFVSGCCIFNGKQQTATSYSLLHLPTPIDCSYRARREYLCSCRPSDTGDRSTYCCSRSGDPLPYQNSFSHSHSLSNSRAAASLSLPTNRFTE
jgi:hypothetical protein